MRAGGGNVQPPPMFFNKNIYSKPFFNSTLQSGRRERMATGAVYRVSPRQSSGEAGVAGPSSARSHAPSRTFSSRMSNSGSKSARTLSSGTLHGSGSVRLQQKKEASDLAGERHLSKIRTVRPISSMNEDTNKDCTLNDTVQTTNESSKGKPRQRRLQRQLETVHSRLGAMLRWGPLDCSIMIKSVKESCGIELTSAVAKSIASYVGKKHEREAFISGVLADCNEEEVESAAVFCRKKKPSRRGHYLGHGSLFDASTFPIIGEGNRPGSASTDCTNTTVSSIFSAAGVQTANAGVSVAARSVLVPDSSAPSYATTKEQYRTVKVGQGAPALIGESQRRIDAARRYELKLERRRANEQRVRNVYGDVDNKRERRQDQRVKKLRISEAALRANAANLNDKRLEALGEWRGALQCDESGPRHIRGFRQQGRAYASVVASRPEPPQSDLLKMARFHRDRDVVFESIS